MAKALRGRPKAPGGGGKRVAGGRKGSAVPKSAPAHQRKKVYPTPKSPRHHPDGRHLPEEMVGGFHCKHCGYPGWREHRVVTKEGAMHATLAFAGCTNCGTLHPTHVGISQHANQTNAKVHAHVQRRVKKLADLTDDERMDVFKDMDTSETGAIRQEGVGHRQGCPLGGDKPCGPDKGGRCARCDYRVQDHQALGKTAAALIDLRKLAGIA